MRPPDTFARRHEGRGSNLPAFSFARLTAVLSVCYHAGMTPPERIRPEELYPLAAILARRFIQRWDCHARQLEDGRYVCVHKPLTPSLLVAHLAGDVTLGTYLLNERSQAKFIVLDADDEGTFYQLGVAAQRLADEGASGYMERSRRGGHLWLFCAEPVSGGLARAFGQGIQAAFDLDGVELYPKQSDATRGPGSLIRLPFGIHRRSGRRYGFVTPTGAALAPTIREQLAALKNPETVSDAAFSAYQSRVSGRFEPKPMVVSASTAETVSGRIKQAVSVLEFVSQFVDLSARGIGKCPFVRHEAA
jgi:hypothetical protein